MGEAFRKAVSREAHTYQGVVYDLELSDYSHRTEVREVLCAGSNGLLALPMAPQPQAHSWLPWNQAPSAAAGENRLRGIA